VGGITNYLGHIFKLTDPDSVDGMTTTGLPRSIRVLLEFLLGQCRIMMVDDDTGGVIV
jgi:hypothetical protein